jgi:S-adenosylmethionine:tRNA ribosyltransferase-isomerase
MKTSDFDYELPRELIAQHPSERRDESRLLVLRRDSGRIEHRHFRNIGEYLNSGDVLVLNETEVIPARLIGRRSTGGRAEMFLLTDLGDGVWEVLVRPGARIRDGAVLAFGEDQRDAESERGRTSERGGEHEPGTEHERVAEASREASARDEPGQAAPVARNEIPVLTARVIEVLPEGRRRVELESGIGVPEAIRAIGRVPLPPYIDRDPVAADRTRYQTVYARVPGAVAAPTAGLHFTDGLLAALGEKGVATARLILHVGAGTFRPVTSEEPADHEMETERYEVSPEAAETVNTARARGGRVVAVGTTSVRALETMADDEGLLHPGSGTTRLFIRPPYGFKCVDALVTNFHLPRSTLLMLVAAFAGRERVLSAYEEAVRRRYRFYSYGDAMLLI